MKAIILFSVVAASALIVSSVVAYTVYPKPAFLPDFIFKGIKNSPPELFLLYPIPNLKVSCNVSLIWYAFDKDNDKMVFYVYLGNSTNNMELIKTTALNFVNLQLEEGKKYFWMVKAFDGKSYSCSPVWNFTTINSSCKNKKEIFLYNYMLYLNGDNDLYQYAVLELNEILNASKGKIAVLVLFDGDKYNDTYMYIITNHTEKIFVKESNMGSEETLKDFISFAKESYPAKHYMLEIWGHGNGWLGVCFDKNDADMLTMEEIRNAIEQNGGIDVIIFSACYMGCIEVAHSLKDVADYMIACEGAMPAGSLPHDKIIGQIEEMSMEDVCSFMIEEFGKHNFISTSFAAWNLSKMDYLVEKLNNFSVHIEDDDILEARNETAYSLQYVDLYSFALHFYNSMEARDLMEAINETIMAAYGQMKGIGVYFPLPPYLSKYYQNTDFAIETQWDELIQ
ncbi:MAG: hypothetical protein DRN29_07420 [Thermoplasmata archaeon]|nr:MAG: hypothetical protein DRN29_07420 [Thermoplasmata archaeon]